MPTLSPYRSLPSEQRLRLVTHAIKANRENRARFAQRLTTRGGFRAVTLTSWPVERLAGEIVRMKAENAQDELDLLHLLYVELEPAIQITFLDAAGVGHENGVIPDDLEPPYTDEAAVKRGATAVLTQHGEDGARYLRTLIRYNPAGWPGIDTVDGVDQAE